MTEFVRRLLGGSRFIILLAVIGTFLAAAVLTLYGLVAVVVVSVRSFLEVDGLTLDHRVVEHIAVEFLSLIDIFLLCTVLYIIALGLYELFIDPNLPLPQWLLIEDLDDLKEKLGGVVIVLIAVNFLANYVQSDGEIRILWMGLGGGAVIVAIAVAFAVRPRHGDQPLTRLARLEGHSGDEEAAMPHVPAESRSAVASPTPSASIPTGETTRGS